MRNNLNLNFKHRLVNLHLLFIVHCSLFIALVSCVLLLASCQKVVDINLNAAAPDIVIEGNITDQPGPYTVKISQSVNFDLPNVFPPVKGANVMISDNAGNSEMLKETSDGIYTTNTLQGVQGRIYTLVVTANGKTYSAISTMPSEVKIDTLRSSVSSSFRGGTRIEINVIYHDPVGIANYYRFVEIINGKTSNNLMLSSDRLFDGGVITHTIRNEQDSLYPGDSVKVLLEGIDANVYEYFRELNQIINGSGQQASPANPLTNLTNGALGYFAAEAITSKKILIPQ